MRLHGWSKPAILCGRCGFWGRGIGRSRSRRGGCARLNVGCDRRHQNGADQLNQLFDNNRAKGRFFSRLLIFAVGRTWRVSDPGCIARCSRSARRSSCSALEGIASITAIKPATAADASAIHGCLRAIGRGSTDFANASFASARDRCTSNLARWGFALQKFRFT